MMFSSCPSCRVGDECFDEEQGSPVREYQRCDALCAGDQSNKSRVFSYSMKEKRAERPDSSFSQ